MTQHRVLIVEDEQDLSATLSFALAREGYEVEVVDSGERALDALRKDPLPDLVLLDLMLPGVSGTEVCRRVRQEERTRRLPIIMTTARSEEIDRVVGFEVGADDYVTKPFSVRELLLRVRAVLRRADAAVGEPTGEVVDFGVLRIDVPGHRAWVEGLEVGLTALEYRLLKTFLERKGRVQTREVLLADVWNIHADVTTRTVDTHVKRLREKLGPAGKYIETLRGVGYRLLADPEDACEP
jgi:two-component system phosphate regulon response regulator PhoB